MAAGRHLLPLPFAETVVARAWFPGALPAGQFAVLAAPSPLVPLARIARHAVVRQGDTLALVPIEAGGADPFRTRAATVLEPGAPLAKVHGPDLEAAAAALTAARIAGLIEGAFALAQAHVTARRQFGRLLAGFQAIQQHMARAAAEAVAARAAAALAFQGPDFTLGPAAVAKVRAGQAAAAAAAILHQVHGAIGMTDEYDLGLFTRRLQELRLAFGGEAVWARRLAERRLAFGGAGHAADFVRQLGEDAHGG